MSNGSWPSTITVSAAALILVPTFFALQTANLLQHISKSPPWAEGKYFPLLPFKPHPDERFHRKRNRKATAVSRMHRSPLRTSREKLLSESMRAEQVRQAQRGFTYGSALAILMAGAVEAIYLAVRIPVEAGLTPAVVRTSSFYLAVTLAAGVSVQQIQNYNRKWREQRADLSAVDSCLDLLGLCGEASRGTIGPLSISTEVAHLCDHLGIFATANRYLPDPTMRASVEAHVARVQRELVRRSEDCLSGGNAAMGGLVEAVGTVLDRLIEQRWLGLLDLPASDPPTSVSQSPRTHIDKRDVLIIMGGALAASVGLGAAASMGVPLAAAVPAALFFLLGPATLWGSKRLGASPRNMLDSLRTPVSDAGQPDPAQPDTRPDTSGRD
ncbi:hypothetical protein [Streptomyces sp. JW3]|uniref:hypothetical protein n=1 Tax=Streptomyces sp. JW3 TaxID=3456955 RepID=UPI003FA40D11